ncbi:glycosyl hydrolase family 28-related protein [Cohnella rhizosphaerae]|uniref:CBM6 domain-containing protein n=1 Tax=Cohnella rhizosphaerae TaxID=1457232 RepID=A0A9X4QU18_9BACL|nr:glycosyl hydrolase family 28-related protein [Cohnella rhizosphaerae]MDG0811004.1 hypothetical protein [Cohnella rhizosphaerae]
MKWMVRSAVLFLLMIAYVMLLTPGRQAAASDGVPYGTHTVPGTIQAEDFNSGSIRDAYFAHASSQVIRETAYRDVANVDLYSDGTNRYVVSSNDQAAGSSTAGYISEYLKYTFTVGASDAGWYDIVYSAKSGTSGKKGSITTLIDNVQKGATNKIDSTALQTYSLPMPVYLEAGTHVLTTEYSGPDPGTYVDWIRFDKRASAPSFPAPQRIADLIDNSETVIANVVVTADTTGVSDAAGAIQSALNLARQMGGGVVYLPSGTYRLDSGLNIPGQRRSSRQLGQSAAGNAAKRHDSCCIFYNGKRRNVVRRERDRTRPELLVSEPGRLFGRRLRADELSVHRLFRGLLGQCLQAYVLQFVPRHLLRQGQRGEHSGHLRNLPVPGDYAGRQL